MKYLLSSLGAAAVRGEESHVERIIHMPISGEDYCALRGIRHIGVTERFRDVLATFPTPEGETPAGFRRELVMEAGEVLRVDLVRDISYDKNGDLRPTNVLFLRTAPIPMKLRPSVRCLPTSPAIPGLSTTCFLTIRRPTSATGSATGTR